MDSIHEIQLKKFKPTADIINRYYGGREVVLWGDSPFLRELLERDYGIKTILVATSIKENVGKNKLYIDSLEGRTSEYYIAVPFLKSNSKNRLISLGYLEFKDFVFTWHDPILIQPDSNGDYHDEYGNHIYCKGCKICLKETVGNTNIFVDNSVSFSENSLINVLGSNSNIVIKKECQFGNELKIIVFSGKLVINEFSTFGKNNLITIHQNEEIIVGKDNMFSNEVKLYSGDGHAIFNTATSNRINMPPADNENICAIQLKDHVCVSVRATILGKKNTIIGQSSIVEAGAVVKGEFPNNCAIAGNPGRIVKKNITWSRNNFETNIRKCGKENLNITKEIIK